MSDGGNGPRATHLVPPEAWSAEAVDIEGDAYRHLFRARRLAVGDPLRLVDGAGRSRLGRVAEVGSKRARVETGAELPSMEPALRLTLIVGALRPERASWLVEKATEVGVRRIRFLATERTPRSYGGGRLDRLRRVATSALEQCGGARLPELDGVHPWSALEGLWPDPGERVVLSPGAPSLVSRAEGLAAAGEAAVLVGPEGGFTDAEVEAAESQGARPVGLGGRVLRVETAALVAAGTLLGLC
ncbi:MAG: RsmE family RNA methyltransferase [Acidobacteriota bacterium]